MYTYNWGRCRWRLFILIFVMAVLVGCKTTEENYRAAYEKTLEGRAEKEDSIYSVINQRIPDQQISNGDVSVPMKGVWVKVTEGGGGIKEYIKKYCVVAGGFKQPFNAKSMRERICDLGYPGAFVVNDSEPYYYVVALSTSDLSEAMTAVEKLRADPPIPLSQGMPIILCPSQIK